MIDGRITRIATMDREMLARVAERLAPRSVPLRQVLEMAALVEALQLTDADFLEYARADASFADELLAEVAANMPSADH